VSPVRCPHHTPSTHRVNNYFAPLTYASVSRIVSIMAKKFTEPKNQDLIALDISPGQACDILKMRKLPSLELAVRIEDRLRIPARWWIDRRNQA
jgi:hypothetical protein